MIDVDDAPQFEASEDTNRGTARVEAYLAEYMASMLKLREERKLLGGHAESPHKQSARHANTRVLSNPVTSAIRQACQQAIGAYSLSNGSKCCHSFCAALPTVAKLSTADRQPSSDFSLFSSGLDDEVSMAGSRQGSRERIPRGVHRKLREISARRKRQRAAAEQSVDNGFSFRAIEKDLAEAEPVSPRRASLAPSRDGSANNVANSQPGSARLGKPSSGKRLSIDTFRVRQGSIASFWAPDEVDGETTPGVSRANRRDAPMISSEANKRVRKELLQQSFFTNRFLGNKFPGLERNFHAYVTQNQLPVVKPRLIRLALLLVGLGVPDPVIEQRPASFIVMRVICPSTAMLITALGCHLSSTRRWWRAYVISCAIYAYSSILMADWMLHDEFKNWTPCQKDNNSMWQLIWFILSATLSALFLGLDLVHIMLVLSLQWLSYVANGAALWELWWRASEQGEFRWQGMFEQGPTYSEPCPHRGANASGVQEDGVSHSAYTSSRIFLDCFLTSLFTVMILLGSARRLNRMDRLSFVNQYTLAARANKQRDQILGKQVELLALFSNPSVQGPNLRPLQLGQEIKLMMREVPKVQVAVEPAAALTDVEAAVMAHNPRIILFSGHSFMGSLAFELPNGRIDLPPPQQFINMIRSSATRSFLR
uniref:Uncharacterized protein n=1 Tax=Haptolina ericina TaxID=156174 RepID=A0A7S3AZ73_9EUKA